MEFRFDKDTIKKARDERNPNARFEMFIFSKQPASVDLKQFPDFRMCCGKSTHICGAGTQATIDALEKYTGPDVERVFVWRLHILQPRN